MNIPLRLLLKRSFLLTNLLLIACNAVFAQGLCTAPNAATGFTFSIISSAQTDIAFTPSSGGADGYLVVAGTASSLSSGPVNGIFYAAGNSLGGGTVVYNGSATTTSATALTPGQDYYYFIYAYQSVACTGGPAYSAALIGTDSIAKPDVFQSPADVTACATNAATFNTGAWNAVTYKWQMFNGGWIDMVDTGIYTGTTTTILGVSSVSSAMSGVSYRCIAYNAKGQADTSAAAILTVNALPDATVTPSGSIALCKGGSVLVSGPANPGVNYMWLYNGNPVANGNTDTIRVAAAGLYELMAIDNNGCVQKSQAINAVMNPFKAAATAASSTTFCAGDSVILNTNTGSGFTYQWLQGGTAIAGATTDNLVAVSTDNYSVIVTNSIGCTDTSNLITINANSAPAASVTALSATTVCQGDSVMLTAGFIPGLHYQWLVNGTPIANATASTYAALNGGHYTVQVGTGASCYSVSASLAVTVNAIPSPFSVFASSTVFCAGQSATLSANNGVVATYQWQVNGVDIAGATADTLSVNAGGQYAVQIRDNNGCAQTSTPAAITVNPLPAAQITPAGPLSICSGSSTVLTANNGGGLTYEWIVDGSLTGITTNAYTAAASGTYGLVVTDANGCTKTSPDVTVTVNALPDVTTSLSGPARFCPGGSVTISVPAANDLTYQWQQNGIVIGTAGNSYTATTPGAYNAVVTNNATGCTDSTSPVGVQVYAQPSASLIAGSATTFCYGDSVLLTANTGVGLNYVWQLNTNPIPVNTTNTLEASNSGDYAVSITDTNGCTAISNTITVTANPVPDAYITYNSPLSFCSGSAVVLTANTAVNTVYEWYKDGILIPGAYTSSDIAAQSGAYTVKELNIFGCEATSPAVVVTVYPLPQPVITTNGAVMSVGNFTTYQWYLNNQPIAGATTNSFTATQPGGYRVTVTNADGCTGTSATTIINNTTAVSNVVSADIIHTFPHPVQDVLHITSPVAIDAVLYDMQGHALINAENAKDLDMRNLASGMYLLKVYSKKGECIKTEKVTKY